MYLLLNRINNDEKVWRIEFEKVASDLLMVSIINDFDDCVVPSYWRLVEFNAMPPLEIGINTKTKTIKNITAFIVSDNFIDLNYKISNIIHGNIVFNTSIFKNNYEFYDVSGNLFTSLQDGNLFCTFGMINNINKIIRNDRIGFLVNDVNELCGFVVYNLNEFEIRLIKSI